MRPSSAIYNSKHANLIGHFNSAHILLIIGRQRSTRMPSHRRLSVIFNRTSIWEDTHLERHYLHSTFGVVGTRRPSLKEAAASPKSAESKKLRAPAGPLAEVSNLASCCGSLINQHSLNSCTPTCSRRRLLQFQWSTEGVFLTCQTFAFSCGSRQLGSPGRSPSGGFAESGLKGTNRAKATDSAASGPSRCNIFTSNMTV